MTVTLHDTIDARAWTEEWLKTIAERPEIATDKGAMLGWFANAIMAGYDAAMQKASRGVRCAECGSRVMDNGYCMMGHWCGRPGI